MTDQSPAQSPRIYSYVRFSSERQLKGDSLTRQNQLIDRYTKEKGYELDSEFRYVDVGVPAFRGQNLKEGKLRHFIAAIREGKVPHGSVLLLESLDRLTRLEPMEAFGVFIEIINAGVKIVTLADGIEHSSEATGQQQMLSLMMSAATICRAHEESLLKSNRLKGSWISKRKAIKNEYYTKRIPRWLKLSENKLLAVEIKEKAEVVRRMFQLCLDGNHAEGIAKLFRNEKVPLVAGGKNWTHSYVSQTLRNAAVTGKFTPHRMENGKRVPAVLEPILGYYPTIVSQGDFDRVQIIMDSRTKNKGGRVATEGNNLFRKKLFCGYCGSSVYINYKGKYYKGKSRKTLICRNAKDYTGCFHISWDYWEFEKAFIASAIELHAKIKDKFHGADLREEIQKTAGQLNDIAKRLKRLRCAIEDQDANASEPRTIMRRISELEVEQEKVRASNDAAQKKLSAGLDGPASIVNLQKLFEKLESPGVRLVIADLISQLFERIDIFPAGRKLDFERLKKMHAIQVKKHAGNGGRVKAYLRDNFDRRKLRFFQPVLSIPGQGKRLRFNSSGKPFNEARLDLVEDLPDDAEIQISE